MEREIMSGPAQKNIQRWTAKNAFLTIIEDFERAVDEAKAAGKDEPHDLDPR